jgi:hypothetical protein
MSPTSSSTPSTTTLTHPSSEGPVSVEVSEEFKAIYLDQGWTEKPATTK